MSTVTRLFSLNLCRGKTIYFLQVIYRNRISRISSEIDVLAREVVYY